ncbi:MAG: PqqD family protein [Gemmatimonadales bacterium]|nr:PqqD family protein [Gemmatimonadales bacterium]MBA3553263.1 PqqD family protein [Gemmatimonadales bacterium]
MLPVVNPEVIYQSLDEGGVLFSPKEEVYFGLNAVGAKVWEALPPASRSWEELFSTLETRYPAVDPATLRADARELIDELLEQGLLLSPADE